MKSLAIALLLIASAGTSSEHVQRRAQVVSWSYDERVVVLCSSYASYQVGAFTSTAEGYESRESSGGLRRSPVRF